MKIIGMLFCFLFVTDSYSLEIDQKLTLRILKTSSSKKTILINRGVEDGLVKGDHAKFYLSVGVVARGVLIKESPRRSVWSIYRLVNSPFIKEDQVMKLKITPAVKITNDESKMLVEEEPSFVTSDPRDIGIPIAEGADDLTSQRPQMTDAQMNKLLDARTNMSLLEFNKSVFGSLSFSNYSVETTSSNDGDKFTGDISNVAMLLGAELYFKEESSWFSRLSFQAFFELMRQSVMAYQGTTTENYTTAFGGAVHLYPMTRPSMVEKFIPYLGLKLSVGTSSSKYIPGLEASEATIEEKELDASVVSYDFLFGYKYFTRMKIGMYVELGFHLRGDQYAEDSEGRTWVYSESGPNLSSGFSLRF